MELTDCFQFFLPEIQSRAFGFQIVEIRMPNIMKYIMA